MAEAVAGQTDQIGPLVACVESLHARPAALFCDLDGTISPIAPDPASAFVLPGCRDALRSLVERLDLVGCLTGRRPEEARAILGLDSVEYWGVHGVLHLTREGVQTAGEAIPFVEAVARIYQAAKEWLTPEGMLIEDKGSALAFHYRRVAEPDQARTWLLEQLPPLAATSGLDLLEGRLVVELRPPRINKGWCIENVARERSLASLVYFGDDRTDAEAFEAIHLWRTAEPGRYGTTVAVANPEAPPGFFHRADFTLSGVPAVEALLQELATRLPNPIHQA